MKRSIEVVGNERTQLSYMKRLILSCVDHYGEDAEQKILQQCLMNSKLFSKVDVDRQPQFFRVTVEERWTLIPIPFVQASSGKSRKAGFYLLESNFLGNGMMLVAGVTISNQGSSYLAMLQDPSLFFTNWQYNLIFNQQDEDVVAYEGDNDEEKDGFHERATALGGGIGHQWNHLTLTLSMRNMRRVYGRYESFEKPKNRNFNRAGFTANYDNRDFKLYYSEGFAAKWTHQVDLKKERSQSRVSSNELQLNLQKGLWSDTALSLQGNAGTVANGGRTDALRIGGSKGFRGIDSKSVWARYYASMAIDYQIPLKFYESGTWTIAPFSDFGSVQHSGGTEPYKSFASYGLGTYFFLRQIALPGLGLELGYNTGYNGVFAAFSAGLAM